MVEEKRMELLTESMKTLQQQQNAMAACVNTLMVTVETLFVAQTQNQEEAKGKIGKRTRSAKSV